jgi:hypothetical protein
MRPKQILVTIIILTGIAGVTRASDTDSLVYEDLQYVKQRINQMLYRLNEMNNSRVTSVDSILSLSGESLEELESLEKNISKAHGITRDSLRRKAIQLQNNIEEKQKKDKQQTTLHFVFHGMAIGLIIYLILYIRSERRKSLQYLISKTDELGSGQDDILQKANELEDIRQSLEKTRKQQKKLKKRIKKRK